MNLSCFADKSHQPTEEEILAAVGRKRSAWEEITEFVETNFRVKKDLKFYPFNIGWGVRYRIGGKVLVTLYPEEDTFSIVLGLVEAYAEQTAGMDLSDTVRELWEKAKAYPDGRWMRILPKNKRVLQDVRQLIRLKAQPTPKKKKPAAV